MEVQISSSRWIARKVVERESPACRANKGVIGGDGCAMRCIIMMSLLGIRRHFSFLCESRYLRAWCYRFARPLGKIVCLDEPSSSLSLDFYKSSNRDAIQRTLARKFRYIEIVFYILVLLFYCSMTLHMTFSTTLYRVFSLCILLLSKWLQIRALKIIPYTLYQMNIKQNTYAI